MLEIVDRSEACVKAPGGLGKSQFTTSCDCVFSARTLGGPCSTVVAFNRELMGVILTGEDPANENG